MKIKFTKDELVARAGTRLSAAHGMLGPTGSAVRAFLALCGGRGDNVSFETPDTDGAAAVGDRALDGVLDIIGERVRVYVCFGTFVADMINETLSALAKERGHREFEVKGVKCYDNNGVLHLTVSIRDRRRGTLHEERSLWNAADGNYVVNVADQFVYDCISEGGMGAPLTRWHAGGYPKGDYCTISNLAAHGTDVEV